VENQDPILKRVGNSSYNKPLEAADQMASNGESGFYIEESGNSSYVCIPLKLLIRWLIRWHHLEA